MSANRPGDEGGLEAYFEQFGDRFREATASSRTPRRPGRRWAVGAVAVACAVAIVLVGILPGSDGTRAVNVVAEAQAALAPSGAIVHMTVTSTSGDRSSSTSRTTEQWSATDPARWRLVQTIDPSSTGTVRDLAGGLIEGREEFSYADGVQRRFLAERNILDVRRNADPRGPSVFGLPNGGDPAAELRAALASGTVTDQGEAQVDGRPVRRLTSVQGTGAQARRFTYDVDPETFAPVQGRLTIAKAPDVSFRFHVDSYERLPLTPQNARLLTITTNSATTVRNATGP